MGIGASIYTLSTTTGKMPVLQQQTRCLFYNNRQDACSTKAYI